MMQILFLITIFDYQVESELLISKAMVFFSKKLFNENFFQKVKQECLSNIKYVLLFF